MTGLIWGILIFVVLCSGVIHCLRSNAYKTEVAAKHKKREEIRSLWKEVKERQMLPLSTRTQTHEVFCQKVLEARKRGVFYE